MNGLPFWDMLLRLFVASVCGGVIGIERGRKHRPAGFRTYMIVCMGAALTMILGIFLSNMIIDVWKLEGVSTDVSRFGAQVINGIGFLGAGTIIVTGRQQVKGMTTAAGLWASACMGLAIGAGFYIAAVIGCTLIILTIVVFSKLESFIMSCSRNVNICVEYEQIDDISQIVATIREQDIRIFDVEISKPKGSDRPYPSAIFSLVLPKKKPHTIVMTSIAKIKAVRSIEEL